MENARPTNLGAALRKYRINREYTVRRLAAEIGIPYATLSRIETGVGQPDTDTFMAVLNWLMKPAREEHTNGK